MVSNPFLLKKIRYPDYFAGQSGYLLQEETNNFSFPPLDGFDFNRAQVVNLAVKLIVPRM